MHALLCFILYSSIPFYSRYLYRVNFFLRSTKNRKNIKYTAILLPYNIQYAHIVKCVFVAIVR